MPHSKVCNPREGSERVASSRPFQMSSWVAMGKWTIFTQPDQAPVLTPCGSHSQPALETVSLTGVTPLYFIHKCQIAQPGLAP